MTDRPNFSHRPKRHGLIGPFGGRQLLAGALVVVVTAVLLVIVTTPLGTPGGIGPGDPQPTQFVLGPAPTNGLKVGEIPPELVVGGPTGPTAYLSDLNGQPVRLLDLRGRAVWLNFWASWCPPCQSETPILRDLAERYRNRGLVVVGISVQESSPANVADYVRRYQLGYTIATDSTGAIFRDWRLYGLPTQFFIGPEGAIRSIVPAPMTEARAVAQIEAILPRAPSSALPSPAPS
ncbi:MAG TPA: TlpA disulfide reductase family protein [Candidatus Limnocylindrales bacterium]|nr:TlpA disulfide reductase family protein [Candidatus Limnocylindrales bacterium]